MYKNIVSTICGCLLSIGIWAQTDEINQVLGEIEQNNKQLQAYSFLLESRQLDLKSGNNLPDPQAGLYYLPWGDNNAGDYKEFQITQSFEFPTVYVARSGLIEKQQEQMLLEYATKRQQLLLLAKKYCQELVYLNKRMAVEQMRAQQAKKIFEQVQELFDKEQVGVLDVNKAKVAWMQEQFKVQQIENDKQNLLLLLQNLNGGIEISFNQTDFVDRLNLAALDSIWHHKQLTDPAIKILKQQEDVAFQQLKFSKSKSLPNLTAGFNYQGVSGSNFSGIYGGASIPLWSNRNKVKAAKAHYQYQLTFTYGQLLVAFADFHKQYNDYQILLSKFNEYQTTLSELNSDNLLLEAYQLGEISFMEYYLELRFYRQAYDSMLEMEKLLNQLKAEILKHQL